MHTLLVQLKVKQIALKLLLDNTKQKQTPLPESASELYRPADRRLSVKLVPNLRIEDATWSA
jgi:hypothetical protein